MLLTRNLIKKADGYAIAIGEIPRCGKDIRPFYFKNISEMLSGFIHKKTPALKCRLREE